MGRNFPAPVTTSWSVTVKGCAGGKVLEAILDAIAKHAPRK